MGTFNELWESAEKGELLLVDGGLCQYHLRRDGQLTIHALIVLPGRQRRGVGSALLARLERVEGASFLLAKCPEKLPSNAWYARKGFALKGREAAGKTFVNVWVRDVPQKSPRPKQLELAEPVAEPDGWSESDLYNHWSV